MGYKDPEYYKGIVRGGYYNLIDPVPGIFLIILYEGLRNEIELHIFITPSPVMSASV